MKEREYIKYVQLDTKPYPVWCKAGSKWYQSGSTWYKTFQHDVKPYRTWCNADSTWYQTDSTWCKTVSKVCIPHPTWCIFRPNLMSSRFNLILRIHNKIILRDGKIGLFAAEIIFAFKDRLQMCQCGQAFLFFFYFSCVGKTKFSFKLVETALSMKNQTVKWILFCLVIDFNYLY